MNKTSDGGLSEAQTIAIDFFQRRTRQNRSIWMQLHLLGQSIEPAGSIGVLQSNAIAHFFDIFWWMPRITFNHDIAQSLCERLGQSGFATPRNTHDNDRIPHEDLLKMGLTFEAIIQMCVGKTNH